MVKVRVEDKSVVGGKRCERNTVDLAEPHPMGPLQIQCLNAASSIVYVDDEIEGEYCQGHAELVAREYRED